MKQPEPEPEPISPGRRCPECGVELPGHLAGGLCPKCLLKAGLGTQPAPGPHGTVALTPEPGSEPSRGLPQAGELFGSYRIVRLLGQGGMGAAFEAREMESGRRLVLKILSHSLDSPDARERFLREGRLAASINHPNSVYVFGTEEVGGTPVISMELVAGGTLQDRVSARGPMPIGDAVDAVLQIITGLEAARDIGVLHRDVKPSNCFIDADGTVKVGDYGLSISTTVRTEPALTSSGALLGTPAFSSPEQLRGDQLDARSDLYSVGATLFYLLTGRTPFEAKNTVQLLATVLDRRAPSPAEFRPDLPPGLAKVILRCLEKQPGDRFRNYDELVRALTPYSTVAPTPATIGLRFLAGTIDFFILNIANFFIWMILMGNPMEIMLTTQIGPGTMLMWIAVALSAALLYYAVPEGTRGATIGKTICRLRVVGPAGSSPGIRRAAVRTLVYVLLPILPYLVTYGVNPKAYLGSSTLTQYALGVSSYAIIAALFSTMRRRNGFASVHDLLTRTRVVSRVAFLSRPTLQITDSPPATAEQQRRIGPYHVLETIERTDTVEWLLGYDLRLLRKVWIRVVPGGTPPILAKTGDIARPGRLRWLTGKRGAEENWDAFEAANGEPLMNLARQAQPWSRVRFWIHDLAREIAAAQKDDTLPALALDRVWITHDGRARLLDFPAPGLSGVERDPALVPAPTKAQAPLSVPEFLNAVAAVALRGRHAANALTASERTMPIHARKFLDSLWQISDAETVAATLQPMLRRTVEVTRWRRAAIVAGCLGFPLLILVSTVFGMNRFAQWNERNPGVMELSQLLAQRRAGQRSGDSRGPTDEQFAVYIATHYWGSITNDAIWSTPFTLSLIKGEDREFAERSVAEQANAGAETVAAAEAAVGPRIKLIQGYDFTKQKWMPFAITLVCLGIYVAFPALLAALFFRGGLVLRLAGVTFVRSDGVMASRLRVFWRAIVAWSPLTFVVVIAIATGGIIGVSGSVVLAASLVAALAALSLSLPGRGLPDRFAGTWPVLR